MEQSASVPPLYLLVKDHKSYAGSGPPPTRPVCGAVNGMNVHLSNIISTYLEAIADEMENTSEVISTEDALSKLDEYNRRVDETADDVGEDEDDTETDEEEFLDLEEVIESQKGEIRQNKDVVICGSDVCSLFPSLPAKLTGDLVFEAALKSKIDYDGLNFKEIVTYLALNLTTEEMIKAGIYNLLPRRKYRRGQKPTVTGDSAMSPESAHDHHWKYQRLIFSDEEKKILFAKCLQIAIVTLFRNHLYQFENKVFRQKQGAPIGLRASCSAARVVMGCYDQRLRSLLEELEVKTMVDLRYMDDLRYVLGSIRFGWRFCEGRLMFRKCWEKEEKEMGISKEAKTASVMLDIQNSIFACLKFEMETPEMFPENKLPTLDFKVWVNGNKLLYSFFQKSMAKKTLIQRKSALGENCKIASLSQNMVRRMKNTSEDLPNSERIAIINDFSAQLGASGYSDTQIHRVVSAGLTGYQKLVEKCQKGEAVMHRSAAEGFASRFRKKLLSPSNWFRPKRKNPASKRKKKNSHINDPEVVTVMFVSQTPGGKLAKLLQKVEEKISKLTNERVRMVERAGRSVKQLLVRSNPWAGGVCDRDKCLPCIGSDGKQDCRSKNIVYDIICKTCEEGGRKRSVYTGMTSRTAFERGREHLEGLEKGNSENALYKHKSDHHLGQEVEFSMKVVRKHYKAICRTVHEAVRINRQSLCSSLVSMNSKSEFNVGNLPRLTIPQKETKEGAFPESKSHGKVFIFRGSSDQKLYSGF